MVYKRYSGRRERKASVLSARPAAKEWVRPAWWPPGWGDVWFDAKPHPVEGHWKWYLEYGDRKELDALIRGDGGGSGLT